MKSLLLLLYLMNSPTVLFAEESNETQLTHKLNGTTLTWLTYTYSGGWSFSIKYSADGASYTMHNDKTPWSKNYPYQALEVNY